MQHSIGMCHSRYIIFRYLLLFKIIRVLGDNWGNHIYFEIAQNIKFHLMKLQA